MNILLINHYAGSLGYGMEYRPYYFAREWVRSGHKVTVVGASYSHLRSKQPKVSQAFEEENVDGIRYVWLKAPAYEGNGFGRIKNMLAFLAGLYRYMDKLAGGVIPDAVIASSTYPLDIYPARRLAKRYRAKLVFEVHDLWPLSPMELGNMPPYHPFIMVMQAAENYAYRHADKVVSLLPKAKEHMVSHGMAEEKFVYIPNGICIEDWNELNNHKIPTGGGGKRSLNP